MGIKINFLTNHMNTFAGSLKKSVIALLVIVLGGQLVVFIFEGDFNSSYLPASTIFGLACVFSAVWLRRKYGLKE